jgi:hypothetical protein
LPGMLFHMMVYARTGEPAILATLNDVAPITGCVTWPDTHEKSRFDRLAEFLADNGGGDILSGMENHLAVDEAMHGPRSPIYPHMQDITTRLDDMYPQDAGDERHSSLAELVVETSLDGVVSEQEKGLIAQIQRSQSDLDTDRIAHLFSSFFKRGKELFLRSFELLKNGSPYSTSSMDSLAASWLDIHEEAMRNLSEIAPHETFVPFYEYIMGWFTDPARMETLRQFENGAKASLTKQYERLRSLDFCCTRSAG